MSVATKSKKATALAEEFSKILFSDAPSAELKSVKNLYASFIGSWDLTVIDYLEDGKRLENQGEWIFTWILEGRAIQDIFISPKRALRNSDTSKLRNRYGTTIRMYDARSKAWRIFWHNPVSGAYDRLVAKKVGQDIVQQCKQKNGQLMRWVFRDIAPNSFKWYAEYSSDKGKKWKLGAEFFATRRL